MPCVDSHADWAGQAQRHRGAPQMMPVISVHQIGVNVRSQTQASAGGSRRSRQMATSMRDAAYSAASHRPIMSAA